MKIIIVGCGKIGSTILESLVAEGHDVVAIDIDEAVVNSIGDRHDAMAIRGSGADCDALREAGVNEAELFIATSSSDELNMLSCFIAKRMGVKHTIARIRNREYNLNRLSFLKQQLDLSLAVNPEMLAAKEMFNILKVPSAVKVETFSHRGLEIIELVVKEDSPLNGSKLMNLRSKFKFKFLICVVQRGKEVYIPDGNFILEEGDKIGLNIAESDIPKLMKSLGAEKKQARNIMLLGGGRVAYYLTKMLTEIGANVKIIERDYDKCQELSDLLSKASVLQGDGAQLDTLVEEGLDSVDAFVALTGMDEENILISIFAASHNVPKVITKINRNELAEMGSRLGLDTIISPKRSVADLLVQYARALENSRGSNVETLYNIMDGNAEVLEFNVKSDFAGLKIPLSQLRLKPNILIVGIIRDRKPIIPAGADVIMPLDRVIVIAANQRLNDLSDILK